MVNSLKNIRFRTMELDEIENHVVICGWNRAGEMLVDEMLHQAKDGLGRFSTAAELSGGEAMGQQRLVNHPDRATVRLQPDGAPGLAVDVHRLRISRECPMLLPDGFGADAL